MPISSFESTPRRHAFLWIAALTSALSACGGRVIVDGLAQIEDPGDETDPGTTGGTTTGGTTTGGGMCSTGSAPPPGGWECSQFMTPPVDTPCTGERFVKFLPTYKKFVGVILCSPERYKILLADTKEGPFFEVADDSGGGQDHCELVNPSFKLPNEDDITSGGCATCYIGGGFMTPISGNGYSRSHFGDPFKFHPAWPACCDYTPPWYECGVNIP
jgi:hypothetical protein